MHEVFAALDQCSWDYLEFRHSRLTSQVEEPKR